MTIYYYSGCACSPEKLKETLESHSNETVRALAHRFMRNNLLHTEVDKRGMYCYLDGVPSQCGAVVAYGWEYGSENGELWNKHMEILVDTVTKFGYSRLIVTMPKYCERYTIYFQQHGFRIVETFYNKRSGNTNHIFIKDL